MKIGDKGEDYKQVVPEWLFAIASPHSQGGVSLFDAGAQINAQTVANFFSEERLVHSAIDKLESAGFEVLQVSDMTVNIAGSLETYEKAFNTKIVPEERPVIKPDAVEDTATFWECPSTDMPGLISTKDTPFDDVLEGVAIEEPNYCMTPSMFPPTEEYWHLRMPGDVSLGCNADRAHRSGITGKGIKVAMPGSGWYKHPFFVGRGYRVAPVVLAPGASDPLKDEAGHGTGVSANIFAVAPDVQLLPVKWNFANSTAAFNTAVGLGPDIIACSWGKDKRFGPLSAADQVEAAAIASAVASGIVVVFSAGNGHWGFPGQHPDVISAGGVYMKVDGSLRASDYASGFMSNIYANRLVPDLCGLVGMLGATSYVMVPVESGSGLDVDRAPRDHTTPEDGWAAFTGTSLSCAQLAGAAALVKQACPRLTPVQVRDVLRKSARDVTVGNCHPGTGGNPATPGPDTATGHGLVHVHKAVLLAKIRCLGPIRGVHTPRMPIEPIGPTVDEVDAAAAIAESKAPKPTELPAPAQPDDLTRIEGIGPKISSLLQAAGITVFAHLASTEKSRLLQILKEADPRLSRLADPSTWPEQANLAATGKWDALKALQDKLKGGRA